MNFENEIFKSIDGFDNYEVSTMGRVKNIVTDRILKQCINPHGYLQVYLYVNGKKTKYIAHRLVSIVFIPNPDNKPNVDHIDGNRTNNNLENLRWATFSENGMNKAKQKNNTSGYIGIRKENDKWRVQLTVNNVKMHCGFYDDIRDAILNHNELTMHYFGEFKTNH